MSLRISVVTPSYNQASFIERTLRSVVEQTGDFLLEYIIVDGGSTDNSQAIIERYAKQDARIRFICEPDSGQSDAINKGLRLATGDIVAFLNSDDIYYPGALQAVANEFTKHPERQWLYGLCRIINEDDKEIRRLITFYKEVLGWGYSYSKLLIVNFISQPATFWRRSCLDKFGYFNEAEHLVMDYDYWCRLGRQSKPIHCQKYLAGFRYYQASKSGKNFMQQFTDEYRIAQKYSHNPIILLLHRWHAALIKLAYRSSQ
ncbi:MAG: glycosyl transferase family 2 [uncultured bacterium]|nr:MAG: glycosyl transferase family 2 [uncultured bacterium]